MSELDAIFARPYAHQVFHAMRDRIFKTRCGHLVPYEKYSTWLNEGELMVIHVACFIWEVTNGGFAQFLTNSSGDLAEEVLVTMHSIGATAAAYALDETKRVIFNGAVIPADRSRRCEVIWAWEKRDKNRAKEFYDRLNEPLGWCEDEELAIATYILGHKEMFS